MAPPRRGGQPSSCRTSAAMVAQRASASGSVSASASTRISGSVPDGRTSTRPRSPSSAFSLATSVRTGSGTSRSLDRDVLLHLRVDGHHRRQLRKGVAAQRAAQLERGGEPVAGDVVAEQDHVTRLLSAEHAALAVQRLEHVAVADIGRHDANPAVGHQRVEAQVRHRGDRDLVDAELESEDGDDLVAVHDLTMLVDGEQAVAVAVEGDPEVEPLRRHERLSAREIRRAAAEVDVHAVRLDADRRHLGSQLLERLRRDPGVGAVRAVDADPEPREVAAEALDDVLEVAVGRDTRPGRSRPRPGRARRAAPRSPPRLRRSACGPASRRT